MRDNRSKSRTGLMPKHQPVKGLIITRRQAGHVPIRIGHVQRRG